MKLARDEKKEKKTRRFLLLNFLFLRKGTGTGKSNVGTWAK
jgi:hypothetical protein